MLVLAIAILIALVVASAVFVYVAYPYRGQETPLNPAVGVAMKRRVESLPTVTNEAGRDRELSAH